MTAYFYSRFYSRLQGFAAGVASLLLLLLCAYACAREEENLFDKPAAQRMSEAAAQYNALLSSAQHGWLMEYFASDNLIGGYTFACTFADGTATFVADMSAPGYEAGTAQRSLYRIASDRGSVLSFDTYSIFHTLSEPRGGSMADASYGGDYEFIITRASADSVFLKGKKHGRELLMLKLSEPAAAYVGRLVEAERRIDSLPRMRLLTGARELNCVKEDHRVLKLYLSGGEAVDYPFIYTEKGMKLLRPLMVDNVSIREFYLDSDGKTLKGDNGNVTLPYPTDNEQLLAKDQWWFNFYYAYDTVIYRDTVKLLVSDKIDTVPLSTPDSNKYIYELITKDTVLTDTAVYSHIAIDSASMCKPLFDTLQAAYTKNYAAYGEMFSGLYIGVNGVYVTDRYVDPNPYAFVFFSGIYNVTYSLHFKDDGNGNLIISSAAQGLNADGTDYFLSVVSYISEHSPYRIEEQAEAGGTPAKIRCVSTKDSGVWFELKTEN
jgi:hypothetical protein